MPVFSYVKLALYAVLAIFAGVQTVRLAHTHSALAVEQAAASAARANVATLAADMKVLQEMDEREAAAADAAAKLYKESEAQRATMSDALKSTLNKEGSTNASLAACLRMPLPDSVRAQLSH